MPPEWVSRTRTAWSQLHVSNIESKYQVITRRPSAVMPACLWRQVKVERVTLWLDAACDARCVVADARLKRRAECVMIDYDLCAAVSGSDVCVCRLQWRVLFCDGIIFCAMMCIMYNLLQTQVQIMMEVRTEIHVDVLSKHGAIFTYCDRCIWLAGSDVWTSGHAAHRTAHQCRAASTETSWRHSRTLHMTLTRGRPPSTR